MRTVSTTTFYWDDLFSPQLIFPREKARFNEYDPFPNVFIFLGLRENMTIC